MTQLTDLTLLHERLHHGPAMWVTVQHTAGSVPREVGAWMAVFAGDTTQHSACIGSVGGGQLEWLAQREALALLQSSDGVATEGIDAMSAAGEDRPPHLVRYALGPSLGQCCGGVVHLTFERVTLADFPTVAARCHEQDTPVALFGCGHVGAALVRALAPLPFAVTWLDSRDSVFDKREAAAAVQASARVVCDTSQPLEGAVPLLASGSCVLIMSHNHAHDFDVLLACLARQRAHGDLPFIGLIGSQTKWAGFRQRLLVRGVAAAELALVTCPIGLPGVAGKQPAVIAVAVAAQLLALRAVTIQADPESAFNTART